MTLILGINAYHGDAAACLLEDGKLLCAVEEERFRRIKHWAGFPSQAIAYCLAERGVRIGDLDHIAVNRDPNAQFWRKLAFVLTSRPAISMLRDRLRNRQNWSSIEQRLEEAFPNEPLRAPVHRVEHHRAHLASSFLVSPFEEAVAVSIDGSGDFSTAAWGVGHGTALSIDGRVYFPHSLGVFYTALTQFIGFPHYGDEYKVMGLAPYGEPRYLDEMRRIVRSRVDGSFDLDLRYFRHATEDVGYQWNDAAPDIGRVWADSLVDLLGPARGKDAPLEQHHKDIARSVQARYEEVFFALLERLHARYGLDAITLSGGCAYNSVANGKLTDRTPFKKLYLQAAAGDAGGAIGAAFSVWHEQYPDAGRSAPMRDAYLGPAYGADDIASLLESRQIEITQAGCSVRVMDDDALCAETADAISNGNVIGWFQGRMEWGPRALGNRSILGDPRRADMKDILNSKIKRRESFRPFAPSVLREAVHEWFETDDDVPFMMKVFVIRAEMRANIPAVTHVDGTGRLQTVDADPNPLYHKLISRFAEDTGVPMLLNTSFNENEPVVCTPAEALDCFLRTNMDVLVLGNRMVRRAAA
jgi:carbamoyltransferase